jgi:hypothetical protein
MPGPNQREFLSHVLTDHTSTALQPAHCGRSDRGEGAA